MPSQLPHNFAWAWLHNVPLGQGKDMINETLQLVRAPVVAARLARHPSRSTRTRSDHLIPTGSDHLLLTARQVRETVESNAAMKRLLGQWDDWGEAYPATFTALRGKTKCAASFRRRPLHRHHRHRHAHRILLSPAGATASRLCWALI